MCAGNKGVAVLAKAADLDRVLETVSSNGLGYVGDGRLVDAAQPVAEVDAVQRHKDRLARLVPEDLVVRNRGVHYAVSPGSEPEGPDLSFFGCNRS